MRILIGVNLFGAGNFGDELMLEGFLKRVPAGIDVVALTPHDIESQRYRFPSITWLVDEEKQREDAVSSADVWLALGDTPFQLDSGPWMLDHLARERIRCDVHKVPMAYLGVGCESESAARDSRTVAVVSAAARIWTRDAFSTRCLTMWAPSNIVQTGVDLAHLALGYSQPPAIEPKVVGLLIAYENKNLVPARALDDLIEDRASGTTRWLIQEGRTFAHTERWNYAALSESTQRLLDLMPFDYQWDDVPTFIRHFGAPEVVISTRYHGALVAAWHGSRIAIIARSEKMRSLAEDFNLAFAPSISTGVDLKVLMKRAARARLGDLQAARSRAEEMCVEFFAWARTLRFVT